uniref:NADH dehydrogenase [ubiquinone] 1 alpha subcomplex subunit 5 n=1 Tax=Anas zonorhyncha TaxID=75864 RepID=A0A8B9V0C8_9AVES
FFNQKVVTFGPDKSQSHSRQNSRLRILYTKILGVLQNIPKDAAYRKYTEQIVNQRLNLVQTETDVQKLQDKLNSGQIEEVILQGIILIDWKIPGMKLS